MRAGATLEQAVAADRKAQRPVDAETLCLLGSVLNVTPGAGARAAAAFEAGLAVPGVRGEQRQSLQAQLANHKEQGGEYAAAAEWRAAALAAAPRAPTACAHCRGAVAPLQVTSSSEAELMLPLCGKAHVLHASCMQERYRQGQKSCPVCDKGGKVRAYSGVQG